MSKSPNLKPKRVGKLAGKPLRVALPFRKNVPNKSWEESENAEEKMSNKIIGIKPISPRVISKIPPLHSSTPKPVRNTVSLPVLSSTVPPQQRSEKLHLTKQLVVVLERVKIEDYVRKETCIGKPLNNPILKKQKQGRKKVNVPYKDDTTYGSSGKAINSSLRKEAHAKGNDVSVLTTIPSEALENFGLLTRQPDLSSPMRSSTKSDTSIIIETPPCTSTACSSVDENLLTPNEVSSDNGGISDYLGNVPSTTDSEVVEATVPILLQSNVLEQDIARLTNVSGSSQSDPLETTPVLLTQPNSGSRIELGHVSTHCDYLYRLNERVYSSPEILNLRELHFSNSDVRLVAPYSLKLHEDQFFLYAAPVSKIGEKYCCLVMGVLDHYIVTYSGHFVVNKDHVYDPIEKVPVDNVKITDFNLCRQHLVLLNVANKKLFQMENYYPKARHPSYCETQLASSEMLMFSINQVQLKERVRSDIALEQLKAQIMILPALKDVDLTNPYAFQTPSRGSHQMTSCIFEPRMEQVFYETCLPINKCSIERVLENLKPVGSVKTVFHDLGSLQLRCATEAEFFTIYYAAYEEAGCMCFYRNVFLLGYVDNHYVVGVVADNCFFIMSTTRLYSRISLPSPGMQAVKFRPEILEMLHLPLWVPYKQSLVMLEARQILRHSSKYQCEYQDIIQSLGISKWQPPTSSFFTGSQLLNRKQHNAWLEKMLDLNFNGAFRNSSYEFPFLPSNSKNPILLSETVTKLWLHQLMRSIYDIEDSPLHHLSPNQVSLKDFSTLPIGTFISSFLPLFGMANDSNFQCLHLGPDGVPSAVCLASLPAHQIGSHIHQCHTLPLLWNEKPYKNFTFVPFTLVFSQNESPPLSDTCDFNRLAWARSLSERWCRGSSLSYLDFLRTMDNNKEKQSVSVPTNAARTRPKKRGIRSDEVARQRVPLKRKRRSNEGDSFSSKRVLHSSGSDVIISG